MEKKSASDVSIVAEVQKSRLTLENSTCLYLLDAKAIFAGFCFLLFQLHLIIPTAFKLKSTKQQHSYKKNASAH